MTSTRRERLEARLERRTEWAAKAKRRSAAAAERVSAIADQIPLGQPILVGHHSERHARRDQARIHSGMRKVVDEGRLSEHHAARARGIAAQLDRSIFSDDDDAIEQLERRVAENEAERERRKKVNKLYAKGDAEGLAAMGLDLERLRQGMAKMPHEKSPYPSYSLTNIGARVRSDKKRIAEIKARQERSGRAEAAGGVVVEPAGERYVRVTFAEKPDRSVIDALKAAGFWWGGGSWTGPADKLPAELSAIGGAA